MNSAAPHPSDLPDARLLSLSQAQFDASGTIYGSTSPVEILDALAYFTNGLYRTGHLGLLDESGETIQIVAQMQDGDVRAASVQRPLSSYPAFETLSAVEMLDVPDASSEPFLTDAERAALAEVGIRSLLLLPLVVSQRLVGLLQFSSAETVSLPSENLRVLRSLADQAAVVFENQSLLRRTSASLDEMRTLYDINRAMLSAPDLLDLLRLVRVTLAPTSEVTHIVVLRDSEQRVETYSAQHVLSSDGERVIDRLVQLVPDLVPRGEGTSVTFIDDTHAAPNLVSEMFKAQGVRSAAALLIRERGLVEDVILITYPQLHHFDARTRRLFVAVADQIAILLQNQRLLRDAQTSAIQLSKQVRLLQTLNRMATGMSGVRDEKSLLDYYVLGMVTALDVDHSGLILFEPNGTHGTVVSEYPRHGSLGTRLELRSNPLVELLRRDPETPLFIDDTETDKRILPDTREAFRKIGVRSLLLLPMILDGALIGSVSLDLYSRDRRITPEMVETAQTMTAQLVTGLQNIRLLTDTQRRAEQLQRIANFSQSVQATLEVETILNIMLTESQHMIPMDRLHIALYDARRGMLRIVAQYENERLAVDMDNGALLPLERSTLEGRVWESQQPVFIHDATEQAGLSDREDFTRSILIAPIRSRGRTLGMVKAACFRPYAYSETDIAVFLQIVNQLAVAIENGESFAQSQRLARNEALINEISAQLQRHTDIEEMLKITMSELGRALNARRARAQLAAPPLSDSNGTE